MPRKTFKLATTALSLAILASPALATSSFTPFDDPPTVAQAQQLQGSGDFDKAAGAWWAIVDADPDNGLAWFNLGYSLHAAGHLEEAVSVHEKAATFDRFEGIAKYNLACAHALLGNTETAFKALAASKAAGFDVRGNADADSDLDSLRSDTRYDAIVNSADTGSAPTAHADAGEWSDEGQGHARGPAGMMSAMGDAGKMQELFQFVGQRMQPIIEEIKPMVQERFATLAQEAQIHVQEIMGHLQQRVHEDEELVSALEQIHGALMQDPRFANLMQMVQQRMGGGGPQHGQAAQWEQVGASQWASTDEARPVVIEEVASVAVEAIPTMREAQTLQNSGEYAAATEAFASISEAQPDNGPAHFGFAYNLHMSGEHEAAIAAHKASGKFPAFHGISLYNLGCAYALTGHPDKAFTALQASAEAGFDVAGNMGADPDLKSLRNDPRFDDLRDN